MYGGGGTSSSAASAKVAGKAWWEKSGGWGGIVPFRMVCAAAIVCFLGVVVTGASGSFAAVRAVSRIYSDSRKTRANRLSLRESWHRVSDD